MQLTPAQREQLATQRKELAGYVAAHQTAAKSHSELSAFLRQLYEDRDTPDFHTPRTFGPETFTNKEETLRGIQIFTNRVSNAEADRNGAIGSIHRVLDQVEPFIVPENDTFRKRHDNEAGAITATVIALNTIDSLINS